MIPGVPVRWSLAALSALLLTGTPARPAETPERVVSMRIRGLTREGYEALRDQWRQYAEAHPDDPLGWTQLAKASRYTGGCQEAAGYARKAIELSPGYADAHAALAASCWKMWCPDCGMSAPEAIRELEQALALDPSNAEPNFALWVVRLSQGDSAGADACLRALLAGHQIPEPILDFGYNLLIGLEPNGIVLTNGDNDTYPPLALQAARGLRPDVAVVNLSLLNTRWYRELLRAGTRSIPVPLLEEEAKGPESTQAVNGLIDSLRADGWKRPLYVSVTVNSLEIPNGRSLEGLVYRVLQEDSKEPKVDLARLSDDLYRKYRLESATSLGQEWGETGSMRLLITNYVGLFARLSSGLVESGDKAEAARAIKRALELCEFHQQTETGRKLADEWLKWDPSSSEAQQWRKRFGG